MDHLAAILLLISVFSTGVFAQFKICAFTDLTENNKCAAVETDGEASCVWVTDSVNCAVKLKSGEANIASFTPEQALVVARFLNNTVLASTSIRHKDRLKDEFAFQAVVVVKSDFTGGLSKLSGKSLCHPGFDYEKLWSRRVLTEFERTVVKSSKCASKGFAAEDEIMGISNYFGKSCRPGNWLQGNETLERVLRKKYSKLCELCDNKETCSYSNSVENPHENALKCLAYMGGEVAYVSLQHVREYFGLTNTTQPKAEASKFQFLCRDGTVEPIYKENPCAWIRQPWPVVVATNEMNAEFKAKITDVATYSALSWRDAMRDILTRNQQGVLVGNATGLVSYLTKGREIPEVATDTCKRRVRWCAVQFLEKEKCDWLSTASRMAGVTPNIECVHGSDTFDCFDKIKKGQADLISIDSNYGYIARKKYELAPVVYHQTSKDRSFVVAVIKQSNVSDIVNFQSLKGANVCFPEYGGIAWVSLIAFGKEHSTLTHKDCDYGAAVSDYFGKACTPGARDDYHGVTKGSKPDKLCGLCFSTDRTAGTASCDAKESNKFYGDVGAMRCLQTNGDVAVIERFNITAQGWQQKDYRVLCRNNTLAEYAGFNVDEACALSVTVDSETITRRADSNNVGLELLLSDLEVNFGSTRSKQYVTMSMFSSYMDKDDLLFKSNTVGFDDTNNPNNKYTKNYQKLFSDVDECTKGAAAKERQSTILMILCVIVLGQILDF